MENKQRPAFWDDIEKQCPAVMQHFGKWIDEYKRKMDWDKLFAAGIKFHDLPKEMQQGVLIKFQQEADVEESYIGEFFSFIGRVNEEIFDEIKGVDERKCRVCGCTDTDCRQCIEKTGAPCHWVEDDLCSACIETPPPPSLLLPGRDF